jgi:catechol 2,3-dioxygenase-like lactoylglutathione lyase family enzyme
MNCIQSFFGVLLMSLAASFTNANASNFQKFGLYVVVADVERSVNFYTKIFEKPPYLRNASIAAFDVAGGAYVVFAKHASDIPRTVGSNTVPYIRVRDAAKELERVAGLRVRLLDQKVVEEGPIKLFRFQDPDGNMIEFFSLADAL